MSSKLTHELIKIFTLLSKNDNLKFTVNSEVKIGNLEGELLKISEQGINTPLSDVIKTLSTKISPLPDSDPDYELFSQLVEELTQNNSIKSLNHIGFCYHVDSQAKERSRLITEIKSSKFKLYEEPSTDQSKWYFIGDVANPLDPMLEMLPAESEGSTFIDYWLPHIHIDLDTDLDENQLESLLYKIYDGDPKPFRSTVIDDIVYSVRTRLGIVDGINLFLDLSTTHRDVDYARKNILKQVL